MSASAPHPSDVLTDECTLEFTLDTLIQHFDLEANGYCCQTRDLWQVLLTAAARGSTIEATCHDLEEAPASNTVRGYLNAHLTAEQVRPLEADFNRALAAQLPRWFRHQLRSKTGLPLALDLHDVPYYGKADQPDRPNAAPPEHWVCRGEAQAGTTRFYRCATAYVLQRDQRWTLAVTFVHPQDTILALVQRLLDQVPSLGLRRGCLYLDKGFCSVLVLRYIQEQTPFAALVAAPVRGQGKKDEAGCAASSGASSGGGTRALCQGRASHWTHHTFRSPQHGTLRVPVAVVRTWTQRRDGKRHWQWLLFVVLRRQHLKLRVTQVHERYRRRFGIESSYRLLEQVRIRTTSPNEALRFFCIGLALLLGSVWIALHWKYLQVRGSGPRRVAREHLTLERMTRFLSRAVEAIYGVVSCVHPPNLKSAIY
jgi:putative transposase